MATSFALANASLKLSHPETYQSLFFWLAVSSNLFNASKELVSVSLIVTFALPINPKINPLLGSVNSILNTLSPVAFVFLLVSTGAVISFIPSPITISLINSVLKSSWIALPGLGCNLAVIVPLLPPTRTILTSILSSSFIV